MRILLIGNPYSIFIVQLIQNLKNIDSSLQIDVLELGESQKTFESSADQIISLVRKKSNNNLIDFFFKIFYFFYKKIQLKKIPTYDVVNIHSYSKGINRYWHEIKKIAPFRIITFWGSDFYRVSTHTKELYRDALKETTYITFTNIGMKKDVYQYYQDFQDKMRVCSFGLETLEWIKKTSAADVDIFKKKFNMPEKIIITCGYASSHSQRHLIIIDQVCKLDVSILEKCFFIFPMGYGDMAYKQTVEQKLKKTSLNYLVLSDFFSPSEIAKLRLSSNIMINILETDQFSGSMQEALFANNIVVSGTWLPYEILYQEGIVMQTISEPSELRDKLQYIISNLPKLQVNLSQNQAAIWKFSSWEHNAPKWLSLYKE
ncbi:MAG: glycosyltransferase [Sulfurimonas sp.]|jgi:glycosyltransferase involved in cell wall biosynthesis